MNLITVKQRFGIIGNSKGLNRALDTAIRVAPSELSVLITGESGTGKETIPQIIHQLSARKHNSYIAVNCGAIPEGTIDSELFGHVKGAFTGAASSRKGYFETADKGTIFLDEIGDLPIQTQARLLRVLEAGEFIPVGSSEIRKTNVRVVAATNIDIERAIQENRFREDLLYRLNTVPITMTSLRERGQDIILLFKKFTGDAAERYGIPDVQISEDAERLLLDYRWPGNIRQLKNIAEQVAVIDENRMITAEHLKKYLPDAGRTNLPAPFNSGVQREEFINEREILYKVLFDMRGEINDLKQIVKNLARGEKSIAFDKTANYPEERAGTFDLTETAKRDEFIARNLDRFDYRDERIEDTEAIEDESLSLKDKELELIKKALEKHAGRRKDAAEELGISERTLYRKIKEHEI